MNLVQKLAAVMAAVERVPKRGRNDFHKYDYATEADIAATIRKELADRHVMLIPSITGEARHPVGEKGSVLTVLEMEMEFFDGESNESIKKTWRGYGTDKEDKGGYKAMTGGEKYFLLKTFLMPTRDDPERDEKARELKEKATIKPSAAVKKARPPLPEGAVYFERVVPRSKGNREWLEVGYVESNGECLDAIVVEPRLIGLVTAIAQEETTPAIVTTSHNGKGHLVIDMAERWKLDEPREAEPMPTADEVF